MVAQRAGGIRLGMVGSRKPVEAGCGVGGAEDEELFYLVPAGPLS